MATSRLCSIPECDKPIDSHGYCKLHADRWRRCGDPLVGRTPTGEPQRFYREVVLSYDGDECLAWPYARIAQGYGELVVDGQICLVSRLVCEAVNGPPPTPKHDAAHSCGNGHLSCVTKRHLSWKTRAENIADMVGHGTILRGEKSPSAKLTEGDVHRIRSLKGTTSQSQIARRFNVTPHTISDIYAGKTWDWL